MVTEADTCRKYVVPKLYAAGRNDDRLCLRVGSWIVITSSLLLSIPALGAPSQSTGRSSRPIDLVFVPQETTESVRPTLKAGITEQPIRFGLTDVREVADPLVVGVQLHDDAQTFDWRATQPALPIVTEFARRILGKWLVQISSEAKLSLSLQLSRYYVTETKQAVGSTYIGEVGLRASLIGSDGTAVWTGTAFGETRRYGRDHSSDNCNEVLSDALTDALSKLLGQESLQAQWAPQPAGGTATAPTFTPTKLLEQLLKLKASGMSDDTIVAFVKKQKLSTPLTADDMIQWKERGIPEAAIQAAVAGQ